jgi:D-sedoheptulose 7-phosphate isomerase
LHRARRWVELLQIAGEHPLHMEIDAFLQREAEEHRLAFEAFLGALREPFAQTLEIWQGALRTGGKLLIFGNGGSAGNAQHIATELAVRYEKDRAAMAALALSADSLLLTAAANDLGYEAIFSRQIAALGRRGDVAVGLSTSGRSPNVLAALREARARGLKTTGFIGGNGGPMRELCDAAIIVPSAVTARIQEMHLLVTHMLCKALESSL